jgi:hypothetical protein
MVDVKIDVAKSAGKILNTRDEAIKLFNFFLENKFDSVFVTVDFTNVEFMSRSFADQFYQLKANWELGKNNKIQLQSDNQQIAEILDAVSRTQYTQDNKRVIRSEVKELYFDKFKQFEEYMLAI